MARCENAGSPQPEGPYFLHLEPHAAEVSRTKALFLVLSVWERVPAGGAFLGEFSALEIARSLAWFSRPIEDCETSDECDLHQHNAEVVFALSAAAVSFAMRATWSVDAFNSVNDYPFSYFGGEYVHFPEKSRHFPSIKHDLARTLATVIVCLLTRGTEPVLDQSVFSEAPPVGMFDPAKFEGPDTQSEPFSLGQVYQKIYRILCKQLFPCMCGCLRCMQRNSLTAGEHDCQLTDTLDVCPSAACRLPVLRI